MNFRLFQMLIPVLMSVSIIAQQSNPKIRQLYRYEDKCILGYPEDCVKAKIIREELSGNSDSSIKILSNKGLRYLYLASLYLQKKDKKTYAPIIMTFLKLSCKHQEILGCMSLGARYLEGEIVKRDIKKSLKLFEFACEEGDKLGCAMVGIFYYQVGKRTQGISLIQNACGNGVVVACEVLKELTSKSK